MIKNIGVEMSQELYNILLNGQHITFLSTYSENEVPYITPLATFYPKNKESILLAMIVDTVGYKNMVWQKRVSLGIVNHMMCINLICRAGVVRAPSHTHPGINIVLIDIIDIIEENMSLISIKESATWSHISPDMKILHDTLMNELKECAISL